MGRTAHLTNDKRIRALPRIGPIALPGVGPKAFWRAGAGNHPPPRPFSQGLAAQIATAIWTSISTTISESIALFPRAGVWISPDIAVSGGPSPLALRFGGWPP